MRKKMRKKMGKKVSVLERWGGGVHKLQAAGLRR